MRKEDLVEWITFMLVYCGLIGICIIVIGVLFVAFGETNMWVVAFLIGGFSIAIALAILYEMTSMLIDSFKGRNKKAIE